MCSPSSFLVMRMLSWILATSSRPWRMTSMVHWNIAGDEAMSKGILCSDINPDGCWWWHTADYLGPMAAADMHSSEPIWWIASPMPPQVVELVTVERWVVGWQLQHNRDMTVLCHLPLEREPLAWPIHWTLPFWQCLRIPGSCTLLSLLLEGHRGLVVPFKFFAERGASFPA